MALGIDPKEASARTQVSSDSEQWPEPAQRPRRRCGEFADLGYPATPNHCHRCELKLEPARTARPGGHLDCTSFQEPTTGDSGPFFYFGRHKTTEQTQVLSQSDVYFASPPEPAQLDPLGIDTDTSTIPYSFDSLSNASKTNRRIHVSTLIIGSPASPRHVPGYRRCYNGASIKCMRCKASRQSIRSMPQVTQPVEHACRQPFVTATELLQLVHISQVCTPCGYLM
jgi:hypothetical protein